MLNRAEVLRYMGVSHCDATIDAMISCAEAKVIQAAQPKHVSKHVSITVDPGKCWTEIDGVLIDSRDLAQHLQGCREGFLFAGTLGVGVDVLVKRYNLTDVPMVPVIQAVAAAYIEDYVDQAQKELEEYAAQKGLYLRPRYSPGYGDFQLENQRFLFAALEIPKRIGVTLTDSLFMVPFKSITAVIGLSDDPSLCHINKCMSCSQKNCPFRRETDDE